MTCIRSGTLHKVNKLLQSISRFQSQKRLLNLCQTVYRTDFQMLNVDQSRVRIVNFRRFYSTGNNALLFDGNIPIRKLQFTYSLSSGPGKDDFMLTNIITLEKQELLQ